jgi:uncharacterized protein YndB with AHSA1/START domain
MQGGSASKSRERREVVITRVYDVPARFLFEAWSKPEHVRKWFGPKGWPITLCEIDFRIGGRFRFAMTGPSGEQNTPFGGTYLDIVLNRKIVYDNAFELPNAEKMVVTVNFDEKGSDTTVTIQTVFASTKMYDEHVGGGFAEGTGSALDQLADVVKDMRGREKSR